MSLASYFRNSVRRGRSPERASILLPFLIIGIGLGVLAFRSYGLSVRMERGARTLAVQYVSYAADITARRVDSAARSEFFRAAEEWQQIERRNPTPASDSLQQWINRNPWVVSAIYVPDFDPTRSLYVSELPVTSAHASHTLTRQFDTATGSIRYTYDANRLLASLSGVIRRQPLVISSAEMPTTQIEHDSSIRILAGKHARGLIPTPDGVAYVAPLAFPLDGYSILASVQTLYVGSGLENHRVVNLWVSGIALFLSGIGAYLAMRGLKKESETAKLRGELVANVSHELRTPLSMIRLGAETLKRSSRLTESQRADIESSILKEVLHLSHLVENVLDVARIQRDPQALVFAPVQPRELVASLMSTYASWIETNGFMVDVSVAEGLGEQLWDRDAVSRALLNLIDNAIKYSSDVKEIAIRVHASSSHVVIEVRDRGIGIAQKDLQRIFEPYFRARFSDTQTRRGAGLGLTLVHQIVESHGGRIEVESVVGSGSTFRLLFPASPHVQAAAPALAALERVKSVT
jgi:signal transduction histidine kinase